MRINWVAELFYSVATGPPEKKRLLTPIGPLFFFGFIGFLIYAAVKTDNLLRLPIIFTSPKNIVISAPFLFSGFSLISWCVFHFRRGGGTPVPFNPPLIVVDTGPYAYSRNPMLTGLFIVILGIGILIRSISLITVYLPLFIITNYVELKLVEEPEMKRRLGDTYVEYMKRTPMFLPKLGRSPN